MNDIKFSYENSNNCRYLVYKIENIQNIDKLEYNMISSNKIEGLLEFIYSNIDDKYYCKYDVTSKITLKNYIKSCDDTDKIIKILINIFKVFVEIEDFLISNEHLLLDEEYVFIDVSNLSIYFICLPVDDIEKRYNLKDFISNILGNLKIEDFKNKGLIYLLMEFLNKEEFLDVKEALNILKNTGYDKRHVKHKEIKTEDKKKEAEFNALSNSQERQIKKLDESSIIGFSVPGQEGKIEIKKSDKKISLKDIFKIPKFEKDKLKKKPKKTSEKDRLKKNPKKNVEKDIAEERNIKDKISEDIKYDNTVIIKSSGENEKTLLLHALNSGLYPSMPYLIRKRNGEKINITSDLFRIGKEADYVDYAISDNNTISRAHSDIIKMNKDYYIQDNNSKNHTYVNEIMLYDRQAVKLEHNCEIKLSDELFTFKLY